MLAQTCPACGKRGPQHLDACSAAASVDYYRCACGHVWNVDKRDQSKMRDVTPILKHATPRA